MLNSFIFMLQFKEENSLVVSCYTKRGLWMSTITFTQVLVKSVVTQVLLQAQWIRICFKKIPA